MPDSPPRDTAPDGRAERSRDRASEVEEKRGISTNRVILILVGVIVLLLLGLLAVAVVPRWWAQRVGEMADGRLLIGGTMGLVAGTVFTAAPIIFLGVAARHLRTIGKALVALVLGLLLAMPNLITLAIALGAGSASHAGQRILDVNGPGFRGGTLVGAVLGVLFGGWIVYLMWSRRRRGRRLAELDDVKD